MQRLLHILSQTLSVVLYPMLIPTYGMAIFCMAFSMQVLPLPRFYWWVSIVGTATFTLFIPLTAIMLLIRMGRVHDLYIADARERTMPYIYTIVSFVAWCYFVSHVLRAPLYLLLIAIGATVAIVGVCVLNRWWKISAHLSAMGGLVGGVLSYHLAQATLVSWSTLLVLMLVSLVLMYARLYLRAHTPAQVVAGWLWGLCLTFLPNLIVYYAF